MSDLFAPLRFTRGTAMKNRFMLAPLTNWQSHEDGTLSQEEHDWLVMRAKGGFGAVMTAAAFVLWNGKGFQGQLGIHDDKCLPGLTRLASAIKTDGALAYVQLYHAGLRTNAGLTGEQPIGPSEDAVSGARAMTIDEVEAMVEAFVRAAERAQQAGFDGVELHGAHTYILCAFLSAEMNRREDRYGGSLENRARIIREIIAGVRARCGDHFTLGLRLSAERMGMQMAEVRTLCEQLCAEDQLDYIDMSLWDAFKDPEEEAFKGRPLLSWFLDFDRHNTAIGVAGQVRSGAAAQACLDAGSDFVLIGRAAIVNHDFADRVDTNRAFAMDPPPIDRTRMPGEGVSPAFLDYLTTSFPGFLTTAA
ncbi:NADH:flavin oxidoreductase [Sphingomonas crocodyli]|uniref:NADH:flavin oxidoreductase n=1 Tax=Sphingomonas crocodyli TaxID=1979270 RepID=A0A437MAZ3_9SPHN|nr:NADH:flavin oxidoreductase [Sphingomonas crocodyli]RVT94824.1 NADH:flavin oxidoreductase [Sphingomonas crocodyli]